MLHPLEILKWIGIIYLGGSVVSVVLASYFNQKLKRELRVQWARWLLLATLLSWLGIPLFLALCVVARHMGDWRRGDEDKKD